MPDPWLTVGQEEELKPYVVIDLWVTQEMLNLCFHWEDMKDMLSNKTYNNVVATYHILNTQKNKVQCHTIQVKPFHPPNLQSYSPSPAQEVQPVCSCFQQAEQQPMDHESGQPMDQESARPSTIPESSPTTSRPSPDSRTATPEHRPGPAPLSLAQTPCVALGTLPPATAPSAAVITQRKSARASRRVARRCLNFLRKLCCPIQKEALQMQSSKAPLGFGHQGRATTRLWGGQAGIPAF
ncbi:hypothetical protein mRhiFer1_010138 [Rhinolophus ferrumequinum]|uniref:Uncharacterized protein n=1 Tax=Rhinolophus ferrumequinum TaxID=59479 RepID=A0A7J7XPQ4_RHIFE|nr:hypothetical protein mRhiFer1_010138 [Rhinolophus ferrumequinum]